MRFKKLALAASLISTTALPMIYAAEARAQAHSPVVKQATFDIPAGDLVAALRKYSRQARVEVIYNAAELADKRTNGLRGTIASDEALRRLLSGTKAEMLRDRSGAYLVRPVGNDRPIAQAPQYDNEIIVTAQKKEERISDVPIAMSAFSAEALDEYKIEGGSELLRAIPNVNFSKSNFSMYNFSIRGIGTKAISAASDPAVAISFNNTPLVRNRLLESEFFDMQRIEVLRGPQGTLYGRNATAGVVNLIPAMPERDFGGEIKGEVGNYKTRRMSGMLNVPITDTLGVRVAGAWTKRDGFDYNTFTERRVNGRDLWSSRATVAWEPSDSFRANLIWQHFEEDDDRSRTGKQLCTRDPGPDRVGDSPEITDFVIKGRLSQGCLPASIYDDAAFDTPHPYSLVYIYMASQSLNIGILPGPTGTTAGGTGVHAVKSGDIFGGTKQSRNLREISANWDPRFRANNDVFQLNMDFDINEDTKLIIQNAYSTDKFWSTQDYHRFPTDPIFNDSTDPRLIDSRNNSFDNDLYPGPTPGGILCDFQLGCSDRMVTADLSQSNNKQYYQEIRIQSKLDDNIDINFGVNYLNFKTSDKYYVFNNIFSMLGPWLYNRSFPQRDVLDCPVGFEGKECVNIEENSINNLQDEGHNYFLSDNNVKTDSYAVFGEFYANINDDVKLTIGARLTHDKKISTQIPSQLLLGGGVRTDAPGNVTGGRVNSGYPALPDIHQKWTALTGRMVLDWKPDLSFSDDTLVYASLSRGYKGGGTNPPRVDFNEQVVQYQFLPQTFEPEFVNALEIGTKNSFDSGRFSLNASAFFYDYKNYQVSQIVDRIAYNENFKATSMGLEFEGVWKPSRAFRMDANLGILKTRLGKGAQSIDVMNRTQDDPDWMVIRPWLQVPSNCVAPRAFVEKIVSNTAFASMWPMALAALCPGATRIGTYNPEVQGGTIPYRTLFGITYDPFAPYNPDTVGLSIADGGSGAPNGGRGHFADLEGNELPNAPRFTFNVGGQYKIDVDSSWDMTLRGDYYVQSKSFARVYNTEFDRLKSWSNVNVAISLNNEDYGLTMQLYIKNLFNNTPITDFFVNSDDVGMTTNIFTLDPRIFGFSLRKIF